MPARVPLPVLAVLALSLAASLLLAASFPLIDPDEGRNAEVAREMVESGDLVVPRLAGMPYLDKPPALFWTAAAAIRAVGPTPLAARLPSAIAGALTLIALMRLAMREGGPAFAARAGALVAAAPLFAVLSAYVIFDMPLTLCVTVVWTSLTRELIDGPAPARRAAMFLAVAVGLLIKGPVMLAWAIGGSLGAACVLRRRDPLRWLGWWPGWLSVAVIAGGWFAAAVARHPEFPRYAFLEESWERLTTGSFRREQPWWFVPAVLVGGSLPWSLATPWLALRRGRAQPLPGGTIAARVALGFLLFAVVFFTFSRSKLVTYLLPALPPLAWLSAAAWTRTEGAWRRWAFAAQILVTPIALLLGRAALLDYARSQSGEPLARAIASAGDGRVRYEDCYSPGTDYLLGRRSTLVSADGRETTSNYQLRYRRALIVSGLWTPLESTVDDSALVAAGEPVTVRVRPANDARPPPAAWRECFRDRRFVAYCKAPR